MRALLVLPLVLLAPILSGCDTTSQYACTLEFRSIQVVVTDASGRPVEGLETTSVLEHDGESVVFEPTEDPYDGEEGRYTVASDAHLGLFSIAGDVVTFVAESESLRAEARYVIADDGCHITKEDGPGEITAVPL